MTLQGSLRNFAFLTSTGRVRFGTVEHSSVCIVFSVAVAISFPQQSRSVHRKMKATVAVQEKLAAAKHEFRWAIFFLCFFLL